MKPIMLNGADHGNEFVEIGRLTDVGVDSRVIAFRYVFLIVRSAENHDRDRSRGRILFDDLRQALAVHFGHVQVHHNQIGTGCTPYLPFRRR